MPRIAYRLSVALAAWIAVTAVVLNPLWPLIGQTRRDIAAMQMVICSQSGMQHQDAGDGHAPNRPLPSMSHCAFCSLAGGSFAVLLAPPVAPGLYSVVSEVPRLNLHQVRSLAYFSYPPANPRAPPARLS